ncbi:MAG: sigma-70 family RNA polymerase sigma factor [Planctomycetia bacterium]|nr:sigma-70 family RNA polymerase sigma factor [Planctomycetia bacterium]
MKIAVNFRELRAGSADRSATLRDCWRLRGQRDLVLASREFVMPFDRGDGADTLPTRPSLLIRMRDRRDSEAWSQFVEVYGPLLQRFLRSHGLQEADSADVTQEILQSVMTAIEKLEYDRNIGRFRGWLFTVAHSKLKNYLHRRNRQPAGTGDSEMEFVLENQPSTFPSETDWEQEYERRLFEWAAERARSDFQPATWQAFWMTAVESKSPTDVAAKLQLSVGAVYIAKSRVTARLKELIQEIGDQ